jgi:hypothetical protein
VESAGIPLLPMILIMIVMPLCVTLFFGLFSFKHLGWSAFQCRRCNRMFQRRPWRRFPPKCPHCHARDWNT